MPPVFGARTMNKVTPENYQELAMRTAKPLDKKDNLIHMALGITSEVGELAGELSQFQYTMDNITAEVDPGSQDQKVWEKKCIREAGDIFWFVALGCETIGVQFKDLPGYASRLDNEGLKLKTVLFYTVHSEYSVEALAALAGEVGTLVKRHVVMEQPLDEKALHATLALLASGLALFCEHNLGATTDALLEENIFKLQDKFAGRYPDVTFSIDKAMARNDEKVH